MIPVVRKVVVPLHGIRTHADWQRQFVDVAQQHNLYCPLSQWNFGYFSIVRFLLRRQREAKIQWFRTTYNHLMVDRNAGLGNGTYPSIVAHSFGTYILGYSLLRYRNIKFEKIILCGSILPRSFPWGEIIERGQVGEIRNEYGVKDLWVRLVGWFVKGAGPSGLSGFDLQNSRLTQEKFEFTHSEYFDAGHMTGLWIPFLLHPSSLRPEIARSISPPASGRPLGLYIIWLLVGVIVATTSSFFGQGLGQVADFARRVLVFNLPPNVTFNPTPRPAGPAVSAPAEPAGRIEQLERFVQEHPGVYDQNMWNIHNELRHLYSTKNPPDMRPSLEHADFILQHWAMDNYILHILSGWQIDKDAVAARVNLLKNAKTFAYLRFIAAACLLEVGDLYVKEGDYPSAKEFYNRVSHDNSPDMEQYRVLALKRLSVIP